MSFNTSQQIMHQFDPSTKPLEQYHESMSSETKKIEMQKRKLIEFQQLQEVIQKQRNDQEKKLFLQKQLLLNKSSNSQMNSKYFSPPANNSASFQQQGGNYHTVANELQQKKRNMQRIQNVHKQQPQKPTKVVQLPEQSYKNVKLSNGYVETEILSSTVQKLQPSLEDGIQAAEQPKNHTVHEQEKSLSRLSQITNDTEKKHRRKRHSVEKEDKAIQLSFLDDEVQIPQQSSTIGEQMVKYHDIQDSESGISKNSTPHEVVESNIQQPDEIIQNKSQGERKYERESVNKSNHETPINQQEQASKIMDKSVNQSQRSSQFHNEVQSVRASQSNNFQQIQPQVQQERAFNSQNRASNSLQIIDQSQHLKNSKSNNDQSSFAAKSYNMDISQRQINIRESQPSEQIKQQTKKKQQAVQIIRTEFEELNQQLSSSSKQQSMRLSGQAGSQQHQDNNILDAMLSRNSTQLQQQPTAQQQELVLQSTDQHLDNRDQAQQQPYQQNFSISIRQKNQRRFSAEDRQKSQIVEKSESSAAHQINQPAPHVNSQEFPPKMVSPAKIPVQSPAVKKQKVISIQPRQYQYPSETSKQQLLQRIQNMKQQSMQSNSSQLEEMHENQEMLNMIQQQKPEYRAIAKDIERSFNSSNQNISGVAQSLKIINDPDIQYSQVQVKPFQSKVQELQSKILQHKFQQGQYKEKSQSQKDLIHQKYRDQSSILQQEPQYHQQYASELILSTHENNEHSAISQTHSKNASILCGLEDIDQCIEAGISDPNEMQQLYDYLGVLENQIMNEMNSNQYEQAKIKQQQNQMNNNTGTNQNQYSSKTINPPNHDSPQLRVFSNLYDEKESLKRILASQIELQQKFSISHKIKRLFDLNNCTAADLAKYSQTNNSGILAPERVEAFAKRIHNIEQLKKAYHYSRCNPNNTYLDDYELQE